uniref:Uncharacterized protein n=1 Tax=Romanomermis culicivorax TaxID=13658 RepID=A0A915JEI0_ROMCU
MRERKKNEKQRNNLPFGKETTRDRPGEEILHWPGQEEEFYTGRGRVVFNGGAEIFLDDFRKMRNDRCGKKALVGSQISFFNLVKL